MAELSRDSGDDEERHDRGGRPALLVSPRHRSDRHRALVRGEHGARQQGARRFHRHPAAGAQPVPHRIQGLHAQAARSGAGAGHRAQVCQGRYSRTLSEPRLFRRRRLWRGCRFPQILWPQRPPAFPGRSRHHRRTGEGAVAILAICRCRSRPQARCHGDRGHGRTGRHHARRSHGCRSAPGALCATGAPGRRAVLHRLGADRAGESD